MLYNKERLLEILKQQQLDALVATTKENIFYFTGFDSVTKTLNPYQGQCYAIITRDDPSVTHVVISVGEVDQVLDANTNIGKIQTFGYFYREYDGNSILTETEKKLLNYSKIEQASKDAISALGVLLHTLKLDKSRIGIDEEGITLAQRCELEHFMDIKFVDAAAIIRKIRSIKTSEEIKLLTYSACCNEKAIQKVINNLYLGINECEIAYIFEMALIEEGARPALTMVKIGRHAVGGQMRQKTDVKLQAGDLIWFDSDTLYKGYWADIARVFVYQEMRPVYQKYNALLKGQKFAISEIRPGMSGRQVFELTMNAVHQAGFTGYRRHHVGHGIGLEPYERPILMSTSTDVIESGMVLSIETPYYEFGMGALHVEDPILIKESGNERLTLTNRELEIIG